MKGLAIAVIVVFYILSENVYACDKWKSEIVSVSWSIGKYIKLYGKYVDNKIDKTNFMLEADEVIDKLENVSAYINSTESCEHPSDKYEKRKELLISSLYFSLPIMKSGEYLAGSIKEKLNNSDDD